jgi:3-isopropylmalate/(R)-2-methylmalate dehydratase small subunit
MSAAHVRRQVVGRGIPLPGNDIDTDRIIPARYLKSVTFEGLGEHVFGDERKAVPEHPFNRPQFQGASVLIAGQNFGCGSSREHAPQALRDWGIGAVVGGSFGEIFFGNCTVLGIPCLTAEMSDIEWLLHEVERHPDRPVEVDIERREVRFNGRAIRAGIPDGARHQLVSGSWNSMGVLLDAGDAIERTAHALPYIAGY